MKRIVEVEEVAGEGLESLLGEKVILLCANYFYTGRLVGVNSTCVKLEEASIVYETGPWNVAGFKDSQKVGETFYVQTAFIEAFGLAK